MSIIAVLVCLAIPIYSGYTKEARFTKLIHDARLIEDAAARYYLANNKWPKLNETPYTKEQVLSFAKKIYDSHGKIIDLDPK